MIPSPALLHRSPPSPISAQGSEEGIAAPSLIWAVALGSLRLCCWRRGGGGVGGLPQILPGSALHLHVGDYPTQGFEWEMGTLGGFNASVCPSLHWWRRRRRRKMPACPPSRSHGAPPKPALLGRLCKPPGTASPGVPRNGGAPRAGWALAVPPPRLHPCPASPPTPGRCSQGGQQGRRATPENAVPTDAEQIGFPMVIGPVRSGDTDLFVPGRTGKGSTQGLGPRRAAGTGAPGCWEHPGVLLCAWTPQGPPSIRGYPQIPPCTQHMEGLQTPSSPSWDMGGPPWSPRELSPCAPSSTHPVQGGPEAPSPVSHPLSAAAGGFLPERPRGRCVCTRVCERVRARGVYRGAGARLLAVIRPQPAATVRLSWRV